MSTPQKLSDPITIQVGERRYATLIDTLKGSAFFSSLLSRWIDNIREDGSFFIDRDGDVFKHVLQYLRSGVLPVFYGNAKGHDYALYNAVLEEARYFGVGPLEKWIGQKQYLDAVKVLRQGRMRDDADGLYETTGIDVEIEYYPEWKKEKVYVCPRGITMHRGNPSGCGRQCRNARGEEDEYVDEDVLKLFEVRKMVIFNHEKCVADRD